MIKSENSPDRTQQINGREGETATFLSCCPLNFSLCVGGFAPRHLNRWAFLGKSETAEESITMKIYFAFVFVVALVANVFAQNAPTVKYSGTGQNRRVIEMSNMLGEVEYMECKRVARPVTGTIVKRNFEDDEVTIASFIMSDAKDKRIPININDAQVGLLGRETSSIVSSLLSKGNKIQVWTYQCSGGGSGIFTYAERVKVL